MLRVWPRAPRIIVSALLAAACGRTIGSPSDEGVECGAEPCPSEVAKPRPHAPEAPTGGVSGTASNHHGGDASDGASAGAGGSSQGELAGDAGESATSGSGGGSQGGSAGSSEAGGDAGASSGFGGVGEVGGVGGEAGQSSGGSTAPTNCGVPVSGPAHCELVAPLPASRGQHGAILLPNGKVFVVGGFSGPVSTAVDLSSAALYDPCQNTWSPAATMADARSSPSAALLPDGRVLVEGGTAGGWSVATAELYDLASDTWTPTTSPPGPGVAVSLRTGKVLLIGADVIDNTTALYDPSTETWSPTGVEAAPRWGFEATLLSSGKLLVSGGFSIEPYSPAVLTAEVYDPATESWSAAGTMSRMRNGHAPVRLKSGRLLVSGGYPQAPDPTPAASTEIYDPRTNAWSNGRDLPAPRWIHTSTLLRNGRVLITGGSSSAGAGSALASALLYDEDSGTFSSTASLKVARWSHTATLLPDGRVLIVGGNDGSEMLSSVEICTPAAP